MNIKEWLKVDEDRVICELETLFMHLNVPAGDIGKLRNAVDKLCVSSGAPEETDYVVKVHCKNGKKTFDVRTCRTENDTKVARTKRGWS